MFQPISSTSAIGYARSLERIIDFINDMKEIQLPTKLTQDLKINISVDEVIKQIEKLGSLTVHGLDVT